MTKKTRSTSEHSSEATPGISDLNGYMTEKAFAELLGVSCRTVKRWHAARRGPPRCKIGNTIRYRLDAVNAWLASLEERPVVRASGRH